MRPAKAVPEFTQTNRKSSVKSGKEGRGFWGWWGGAGEEFGIDFHSAFPAALNLQRERERERVRDEEGEREREREREGKCSLDIVVQKELLSLKPPSLSEPLKCPSKRELFFDLTEARWEPRGVVGDAARYAPRPTPLRTDLSRVSSACMILCR